MALLLLTLLVGLLAGCTRADAPIELEADRRLAEPAYWFARPGVAQAHHDDFDVLWDAAERVAREYLFTLDRIDYRGGVLTTRPEVSGQFFEFWRRDTATSHDWAESSLGNVRRTLRFEFARLDGEGFEVVPKVLVEREAVAERRITSVLFYRQAFSRGQQHGTPEADRGIRLPARYWYAIGRDEALEQRLATAIERKLR